MHTMQLLLVASYDFSFLYYSLEAFGINTSAEISYSPGEDCGLQRLHATSRFHGEP